MGYNISTIKNLPMLSGYYFFLVGKKDYAYNKIDSALYRRFDEIAERIGSDSAIVKSFNSQNINKELLHAFTHAPWFGDLYDYFLYQDPALIIMHPHPNEFHFNEDDFFALIPFSTLDEVYLDENELIHDIISLSIKGEPHILNKIARNSKRISLMERLQDSSILQPNLWGLGIDLKKLFKHKEKFSNFIFYEPNNPNSKY